MKKALSLASVGALLFCTSAVAQAPATAAPKADKQAISKACSAQADAKGLHGKARKKFRSECRAAGGKLM